MLGSFADYGNADGMLARRVRAIGYEIERVQEHVERSELLAGEPPGKLLLRYAQESGEPPFAAECGGGMPQGA